ncbi:MAG: hypothetical protein HYZ72_16975 [Deltaproteobacteria bacterium]|nr:hypothetical protein [Deltaproteobacteria bacterium]
MARLATETVEIFGTGVLHAEGVVIDRDGNAWGGGRNGTVYKVSPDGVVHQVAQLPAGSVPNGVTLDRTGNAVTNLTAAAGRSSRIEAAISLISASAARSIRMRRVTASHACACVGVFPGRYLTAAPRTPA